MAANLPVLLWGEPGIGKSAGLERLSQELGLPLETVIASVHEPSDFAGLPIVGDDPATTGVPMAPPDWAVRVTAAGRGLVFFDELSSAPPAVQAALLRVVLERRVGSLTLPEPVRIVAAANPPSSAADGWHLSPPLANRFVHLRWTHDPATVARGLAGTWPAARIPPSTRGGSRARWRGRGGGVGVPDRAARAGAPSARRRGEPGRGVAVAAHVGDGAEAARGRLRGRDRRGGAGGGGGRRGGRRRGVELVSYLEELDLPDPNRVLADPGAFKLPDRGDRQLAFLTAVVAAVQGDLTQRRWEAGWTVLAKAVDAGVPDVAARAAMDLAAMRDLAWPVPPGIDAFIDLLQLSGAL